MDWLGCYMDGMTGCFEDFVTKSLILLTVAAGVIIAMGIFALNMLVNNRPEAMRFIAVNAPRGNIPAATEAVRRSIAGLQSRESTSGTTRAASSENRPNAVDGNFKSMYSSKPDPAKKSAKGLSGSSSRTDERGAKIMPGNRINAEEKMTRNLSGNKPGTTDRSTKKSWGTSDTVEGDPISTTRKKSSLLEKAMQSIPGNRSSKAESSTITSFGNKYGTVGKTAKSKKADTPEYDRIDRKEKTEANLTSGRGGKKYMDGTHAAEDVRYSDGTELILIPYPELSGAYQKPGETSDTSSTESENRYKKYNKPDSSTVHSKADSSDKYTRSDDSLYNKEGTKSIDSKRRSTSPEDKSDEDSRGRKTNRDAESRNKRTVEEKSRGRSTSNEKMMGMESRGRSKFAERTMGIESRRLPCAPVCGVGSADLPSCYDDYTSKRLHTCPPRRIISSLPLPSQQDTASPPPSCSRLTQCHNCAKHTLPQVSPCHSCTKHILPQHSCCSVCCHDNQ